MQKSTSLSRRLLKFTVGFLVLGLLVCASVVGILIYQLPAISSFEQIKAQYQPSDTLFLDRNNILLQRIRVNFEARQGSWTTLDHISPAMISALLASEDKRFYHHLGVDPLAVLSSIRLNLSGKAMRGASTLSMQLVGLLDYGIAPSGSRSWWQKLRQASIAVALERQWTKQQILEAYLNLVPLRGEIIGIDALSQGLFEKSPDGLNSREAALAAAMIRSPNVSEQVLTRRACTILEDMQTQNWQEECNLLGNFIHVTLTRPRQTPTEGIIPHLAVKLLANIPADIKEKPGKIKTTIDEQVQRTAINSLRQHLLEIRQQNVSDGAVVVLDNTTGEILAWVGSSGTDLSHAAQYDAVTAMRQPGSTLKPFLYALAIEQKRLTAASLLNDAPVNLNVGNGLYAPQNYDRNYKGWVSVRTALASSLNIPAVRTLVMIGPGTFAHRLLQLGLPLQKSGNYYGYSLALGSAEVTLLTLTNAYRALANQGQVNTVRWLDPSEAVRIPNMPVNALNIAQSPHALSPEASWIISTILSDREARVTTFGLDSKLNTRYWSAVKTGTSKDMRDNWAIGYSARYTVGVWVGNASGSAMWDVSGTSGAAPVWQDIMNFLYTRDQQNGHSQDWIPKNPPADVIASNIRYLPAIEPSRLEWFIKGTEQPIIRTSIHMQNNQSLDENAIAQILEPVSGTIIAIDPDIPPQNQRLLLRCNRRDVQWKIGPQLLGKGAQIAWSPLPGRHRISIVDFQGQELDRIRIEVRGASLKRPILTEE